MKKSSLLLAVLAFGGAAFAQVNPARPMVTGRGNVAARPGRVIVTHQTATEKSPAVTGDVLVLDQFTITGSLLGAANRGHDAPRLEVPPQKSGALTTALAKGAIKEHLDPEKTFVVKPATVPGATPTAK